MCVPSRIRYNVTIQEFVMAYRPDNFAPIPAYFEHVTFDDRINLSKKTLNLCGYTSKHL